jgi:hypothetical protein
MKSYDELEEATELNNKIKQKFRLLGPLGKLHNIIVFIRSSPGRTEEFVELAQRMVPLDNRTRWNSWYLSLVVADKLASPIDIYTKANLDELSEDYLTPEDWKGLCTIMAFLQLFHRATLETQGHRATLEKVLFTMDILAQYFKNALVNIVSYYFF